MKKTQVSSLLLPKVQVISKAGKVISDDYAKTVELTESGSIVKLSLDKGDIIGTQKINDDLVIINRAHEEVVVKDFFKSEGKIVIDDNGELYVSSYDSPFNGLNFSSVDSIESVIAGEAAESTPAWVLPVVAAVAVGGIAAAIISNHNDDDSSTTTDNSGNATNNGLQDALSSMQAQLDEINSAREALQNAINNMKVGGGSLYARSLKSTSSLDLDKQAIEDSKSALETAIENYQTSVDQIEALLATLNASAKTPEVLQAIEDAKALLTELEADIAQAQDSIDLANSLLDAVVVANEKVAEANAAIAKAQDDYAQAKADLAAANQAMQNAALSNDLSSIDDINKQIDDANAALEAAKEAYNDAIAATDEANSLVDDIINSGVTTDYVGLDPVDDSVLVNPSEDLTSINSHLEAEPAATIFDVIKDFVGDVFAYVKDFVAKYSETTLGGIVSDVIMLVDGIVDSIIGKVMAPCQIIGVAIQAIKGIVGESIGFAGDIVKAITSSIYEAITGAIGNIGNIISGAISGVTAGLADLVSGGNILSAIYTGIKTSVGNVFSAILAIPGKTISAIIEKVKTVAGDLWDCISAKVGIITNAISDIFTIIVDNFVKSTIIWPVVDSIINIITHPVTTVKDIIASIFDLMAMAKDLIKVPGDLISGIVDLIENIIDASGNAGSEKVVIVDDALLSELIDGLNSLEDATVTAKTESMLETLEVAAAQEEASVDAVSEELTIENVELADLISEGNADIDLDSIVPVEAEEVANVDHADVASDLAAQLAQMVLAQEEDYAAYAA